MMQFLLPRCYVALFAATFFREPSFMFAEAYRIQTNERGSRLPNLTTFQTTRDLTNVPLVCDSVSAAQGGGNQCVVGNSRQFLGDFTISPQSLVDSNGQAIQQLQELVIGSTLGCQPNGDETFCKISVQGFASLNVQPGGTIEASDIYIEISDQVTVSGRLTTSGRGYPGRQGDSPALYYVCCTIFSAASHGGRGGNGVQSLSSGPTYGSTQTPEEYGSGGLCYGGIDSPLKGGGKIEMESRSLEVIGSITANASPCERTQCSNCGSGSGGSIWIKTNKLFGSGLVSATGGAFSGSFSTWASGGGGRIALYVDERDPSMELDVSARSPSGANTIVANMGQNGTLYQECKTTFCDKGGSLLTGLCRCDCPEPEIWGGHDCSQCMLSFDSCQNGGILNATTCQCECPPEFTGATCNLCNANFLCNGKGVCNLPGQNCSCRGDYYGDTCETFCNPSLTCGGLGICDELTGQCRCKTGKAGPDCTCDEVDCLGSNPCSGGGVCQDGACNCMPGLYGCNCEIECSDAVTCSGHGTCQEDGTCDCDVGWEGDPDCGRQDIGTYCSDPSKTISGKPCLHGVDALGSGLDSVTGQRGRGQIIPLRYTEGRLFNLDEQTAYEIPDGVSCEVIRETRVSFSTKEYQGSLDFRRDLAVDFNFQVGFRGATLSQDASFQDIASQFFKKNRILFSSTLDRGIYRCWLDDSSYSEVTKWALDNTVSLSGDRRFLFLGTHIIRGVTLGGRISIFNFVESCASKLSTLTDIQTEVEASVFAFVAAGEGDGSATNVVSKNCSVFSRLSLYERKVKGGDGDRLAVGGAGSAEDLVDYLGSIRAQPDIIKYDAEDISYALDGLVDPLDQYYSTKEADFDDTLVADGTDCRDPCKVAKPVNEENTSTAPITASMSGIGFVGSFVIVITFSALNLMC